MISGNWKSTDWRYEYTSASCSPFILRSTHQCGSACSKSFNKFPNVHLRSFPRLETAVSRRMPRDSVNHFARNVLLVARRELCQSSLYPAFKTTRPVLTAIPRIRFSQISGWSMPHLSDLVFRSSALSYSVLDRCWKTLCRLRRALGLGAEPEIECYSQLKSGTLRYMDL